MKAVFRTPAGFFWPSAVFLTSLSIPTLAQSLLHQEEMTVTAQKREQGIQQVPISVTALGGEQLRLLGIDSSSDLGRITPGVEMINESVTQPEYIIRGIQTRDFTVGSDASIAVYIDGIYATRAAGAEQNFHDIERVEILKGPQGTLYGRNATGGAIHIITHKPTFEREGRVTLGTGSDERRDLYFVHNEPLSDTTALRVSGTVHRTDGYLDSAHGPDWNGEDNHALRASLRWNPQPETDVVWRMDFNNMDQNSGTVYSVTPSVYEKGSGHPFRPNAPIALDTPNIEDREQFGTSIEVQQQLGDMTFTSLTGYRATNAFYRNDEDGSADPGHFFLSESHYDQDQFSQEFRLNGERGPLQWTVGGSYLRERIDYTSKAGFNYDTLENFALFSALTENSNALAAISPLFSAQNLGISANASAQEVAQAIPGIRNTLSRFGLNGIALSSFTGGLLRAQPAPDNPTLGSGRFGGLHGISAGTRCPGGPFSSAGAAADTLGYNFALACALLPQIQSRLGTTPWNEYTYNQGEYDSAALYGDATLALSSKTNLSAGLRYSYDEKDFTLRAGYNPDNYFYRRADALGGTGLPMALALYNNGVDGGFVPQNNRKSWDALSGRLVLDHSPRDDLMLYGSVATGFKAGGFNSLSFGPEIDASFDQEEVISYEMGFKSDWFDQRLRFNTALFYYEYDHKQDLELAGSPVPTYYILLADARGSGVEAEWLWAATEQLSLGANYTYLDTEITQDYSTAITGKDRAGQPLTEVPHQKINLSALYEWSLMELGTANLRLDYHWSDDRLGKEAGEEVKNFALINTRGTWYSRDQQWQVAVSVNNVMDKRIIADYTGPAKALGAYTVWRYPERTYGLEVTYAY